MSETLKKVKCGKCGKAWFPRIKKPEQCPGCGCRNWEKYEQPKRGKK